MIPQLTPAELVRWRSDPQREQPFVLDVREAWELGVCRLEDAHHVPLAQLPAAVATLPRERDIVLVCHHGRRSMHAGIWLRNAGFDRVHNLQGGMAAWASDVDPTMARY
ncbi:MAG: rhodanese-like domain-containing protein [Betaproteobacteria bacterium]|nr:rhodanese-like domain-containing protein [Betaproteobacteria bacterium]